MNAFQREHVRTDLRPVPRGEIIELPIDERTRERLEATAALRAQAEQRAAEWARQERQIHRRLWRLVVGASRTVRGLLILLRGRG
jgi:hypothetical protein